MKNKTGLGCPRLFCEIIVLPLFGFISFILNSVSAFTNINSFQTRPFYAYETSNEENKDPSKVYVLDKNYCDKLITEDQVTFVNELESGYHIFLFIIYFITCLLSFTLSTSFKIMRNFASVKSPRMKKFGIASTSIVYGSFMASVPSMYSFKVNYGTCIQVEGILWNFMTKGWMIVSQFGFWCLLLMMIILSIQPFVKDSLNLKAVQIFVLILALCGLGFMIMALVTKFGSVVDLQIAWDISLSIDLTYGAVSLKFDDWTITEVNPLT